MLAGDVSTTVINCLAHLFVNSMSLNVPNSLRMKYELVTLITKMTSESVKEQDFVEQAF